MVNARFVSHLHFITMEFSEFFLIHHGKSRKPRMRNGQASRPCRNA
jgi:hypothetical protein